MILHSEITRRGCREINEDALGVSDSGGGPLLIVADGLGGHGHGEIASRCVTECFVKSYPNMGLAEPGEYMERAYRSAQKKLLDMQREKRSLAGMRTTGVSLIWKEDSVTVGHIGDSRAYLFGRFGGLMSRTLDHSVVQMLALDGQIKEKQIRRHPDRCRLLRALGDDEAVPRVEITRCPRPKAVRAVLLCSDGVRE